MKRRAAPKSPKPLKPICTSGELAVALQKSRDTIWRWTASGMIPKDSVRRIGCGKQVRYLTARLRAAGLLPEAAHG